jgi:serine/threonine protein phosphatase PrpC
MFSSIFRSPAFRRSTAASTSIAGLLTVAVSANAWVANNAVSVSVRCFIAPATRTTLAEAAPSRASFSSSSSNNKDDAEYSSVGRSFFPQDVYYDSKVKETLEKLRTMKRDGVDVDVDVDAHNDNDNATTNNTTGILGRSGQKFMGALTLVGYKGGSLDSQINQDRAVVISPFWVGNEEKENDVNKMDTVRNIASKLIGCFDGHARLGEVVSEYVVKELPKLLASKLEKIEPKDHPEQVTKAISETFIEMDKTAPAEVSGGCTATIILQRGSKLYVANAGDSRSFVVVYLANKKTAKVIYISREDKPNLPDERERVEKAGGQVLVPLYGTSRVLYTDPESGLTSGLAMSRSIGDWEVGKFGVIPDPIVDIIDIDQVVKDYSESDDDVCIFAVSATDGLMDYTTPEGIAKVLATSLYEKDGPHLMTALEQLIYVAASGWERSKRGTYRDDIAISVSEIRIPPNLQ